MTLRLALRSLARSPGFTGTAVLTLALGIGAATAIFSVVNAVMLRPVPYPHAERLVRVWETTPEGNDFVASDPNYLDYRDQNRSFEALAAYKQAPLSLTGSGAPRRLEGMAVTHDIFPLLGGRPALGRTFLPEEDLPGGDRRVVVLSHSLWQEEFGADPALVGTTITLDREPHTVTGVMPPGFDYPAADLWVPLAPDPGWNRDDHWLEMVGRLRPGVEADEATVDLIRIAGGFGEYHPVVAGWGARVEPFAEWLVGPRFRRTMVILLGGAGCLLLIGCLNLANLLLARATVRQTEIGIRAALGAGRARIAGHLIAESLLLAAAGGALGLLGAVWGLELVRRLSPQGMPRAEEIGIDGRVVGFAFLLALSTSVLFGLAPALRASRVELTQSIGGARTPDPAHRRMRSALVVAQIALATVLLAGAGVMMRSLLKLQAADPGFDAARVAAVPLQFDASAYGEAWRRVVTLDQAIERVEAIPGVEAVGATAVDPFSGWNLSNDVTPFERAVETGPSGLLQAGWRAVTPGFFRAMGLPVLSGRTFEASDRFDGPPVAVISATLADQAWPGEEAVGKRLYWGGIDGEPFEVIGVVGDYLDVEIDSDPQPLLFLSNNQLAWPSMTLIVRSSVGPDALVGAIREQLWTIDPLLPVPEVRPLDRSVSRALAGPRFRSLLLGSFAAIALLLAAVGVYGVTAFATARRSREFGVRLALGATPAEILRMVVRNGAVLAAGGIVLGVAGAWALTRLLESLLYEVSPADPATFLLTALVLGLVTLLASYLPGRRAARTDPADALRDAT